MTAQGRLLLGVGAAHDIDADRVTLTGTTDGLPGFENLEIESTLDRRDTRFDAFVGWQQDVGDNRVIAGTLRGSQAAFGSAAQIDVGVKYTFRF